MLEVARDEVDLGCDSSKSPRRRRSLLLGSLLRVEENGDGRTALDRGIGSMAGEGDEVRLVWGGHMFCHKVTGVGMGLDRGEKE